MKAIKLLAGEPLAITEAKFQQILAYLELRESGRATEHISARAVPEKFTRADGMIGVLPIFGVIGRRMSMMDSASGGTSLEKASADLDSMAENPAISTIILQFDSPGGSVYGVSEFAAKVRAVSKQKQVIGMVDSMAASAAYWIASACGSLVASPSSDVGSIGVIATHVDETQADENAGVKYTFVSAGKYKAEGYQPLTSEALAALQSRVDNMYGSFVDAVAKYRDTTTNKVTTKFGEGRIVQAADALSAGMVDRIATMDDVLAELTASKKASQNRAALYNQRKAQLTGV